MSGARQKDGWLCSERAGVSEDVHTAPPAHPGGRCDVPVGEARQWEAGNPGPASKSSSDFIPTHHLLI